MKYLKTNEEYNSKEDISLIEEEIIQMMYSITDEYQVDSSEDKLSLKRKIISPFNFKLSSLVFRNIILKNKEELDDFSNKIFRISKVVSRRFDMEIHMTFQNKTTSSPPYTATPERMINISIRYHVEKLLYKEPILATVYFYNEST